MVFIFCSFLLKKKLIFFLFVLFLYNFKNFYNFMKNIFVILGTLTLFGSLREDIWTIV
jgi:hypothetical protein